jgi:hypothetical protein
MLRMISTAILGFALALPIGAAAAGPLTPSQSEAKAVNAKAPEATLAANEDAVVLPPPVVERVERPVKHSARRGSNQSAAGFRFTNPYAFPVQTLPVQMPSITTFNF